MLTTLVTLFATTNSKSYTQTKLKSVTNYNSLVEQKTVLTRSEKRTYLSTVLITYEETILDFDNAYHVAVLNFILLLLLLRHLGLCVINLVMFVGLAHELLLLRLGPLVKVLLGELRALPIKVLSCSLLLLHVLLLLLLGLLLGSELVV